MEGPVGVELDVVRASLRRVMRDRRVSPQEAIEFFDEVEGEAQALRDAIAEDVKAGRL